MSLSWTTFPHTRWVNEQRTNYKDGKLPTERVSALEAVPGWCWDQLEAEFVENLERLRNFAANNGHARVPSNYRDETGFPLGRWVYHRREAYKKDKLSKERIAALESVPGWVWIVRDRGNGTESKTS